MSYAAEPYAQFVDDLLTSLTGGIAREEFTFDSVEGSFRLSPPGPILPSTVRVFGQARGQFQRFVADRDYLLTSDGTIAWQSDPDGGPAADAVWPDEGTPFFANYDHAGPGGAAPTLSDRNPGSVVRLLAESFAREYAVVSRQLEAIYKAGFLDTATGRDLDRLVALVGVTRRTRTFATGAVIFSRSSPAPADIFIPAGTRVSTSQPPTATFETSQDGTLRRGELSVEIPVVALESGAGGLALPRTITVIHRPILGIDGVINPQSTQQTGTNESDSALRARVRRALEAAGQATTGALLGSLATLPGVRENHIRIAEDHLARPGVVTLHLASPLDGAQTLRAQALIEATRPAGIRVLTNLDAPEPPGGPAPPLNTVDDSLAPSPAPPLQEDLYQPVKIRVVLLTASGSLGAAEKNRMKSDAAAQARGFVDEAGIGEVLVYNRLVARLMSIEGIKDVALELYPKTGPGQPVGPRHQNLIPSKTLRPRLDGADLSVEIAGELVAFDITVTVALTDLGKSIDPLVSLEMARVHIMAELQDKITGLVGPITAGGLAAKASPTEYHALTGLTYRAQYIEAGIVINTDDPPIELAELERAWIRSVRLAPESG